MTPHESSERGTRPLSGSLRNSWIQLPLGTQLGLAATTGALAMVLFSTLAYMITPRMETPHATPHQPRPIAQRTPGGPVVKTEVLIPPQDATSPTTIAARPGRQASRNGTAGPLDDKGRMLERRQQEDQSIAEQQRLEDEKRTIERRIEDQQLEAKRRAEDQQIEDQRRAEEKQRREARDAENLRQEAERKQKQQSAREPGVPGDEHKFAAVP